MRAFSPLPRWLGKPRRPFSRLSGTSSASSPQQLSRQPPSPRRASRHFCRHRASGIHPHIIEEEVNRSGVLLWNRGHWNVRREGKWRIVWSWLRENPEDRWSRFPIRFQRSEEPKLPPGCQRPSMSGFRMSRRRHTKLTSTAHLSSAATEAFVSLETRFSCRM